MEKERQTYVPTSVNRCLTFGGTHFWCVTNPPVPLKLRGNTAWDEAGCAANDAKQQTIKAESVPLMMKFW